MVRGIPCVTSGTQKWNGDSPSLMARAIVMSIDAVGLNILVMVHWPEYNKLITTAIMSSIDAVAWVRKYLVEASMARGLKTFIIMGIMAIVFISNPIQANNQWELVITIIVPRMSVVSVMMETNGFISMGRV